MPSKKSTQAEFVKGARSAYILFCNTYADKKGLNKETLGDAFSVGDRGKACGAAWGKIKNNNTARKPYDDLAAADLERFQHEYTKLHGYAPKDGQKTDDHKPRKRKRGSKSADVSEDEEESAPTAKKGKGKGTKAKSKKDPNAPKRPPSAYLLYSMERRPGLKAEQPDLKNTDIVRTLAAEWKALNANEQAPYHEEAAERKAAYEKAKAAYDKKAGKA